MMMKGRFILAVVIFLIAVVIAFYFFFDYIDLPDLSLIPYYAAFSLLRMSVAYFFALCFALFFLSVISMAGRVWRWRPYSSS
jgi:hypothetical protein